MWRTAVGFLLAAAILGVGSAAVQSSSALSDIQPGLHVIGNRLVNSADENVLLLGANRPGTEYACAQGWGVFDGPSDMASIAAMSTWGMDVVRVPLNEDCWLGINVPRQFSGATYRIQIEDYVARLNAAGLDVILDLHWSAPGTTLALQQEPMPDSDHTPAFWRSVATAFRSNPNVAFELYNEPHGVTWRCWQHGCAMPGGWRATGMQQLIDAVRSVGASQPILVDGLDYANELSGFVEHPLRDPDHAIVAAFHVYAWNSCSTARCWQRSVIPVARRYPVVATETGENDCSGAFVGRFISWAMLHDISILAWAWTNTEGCESLISGYAGKPTLYGEVVKTDYLSKASSPIFARALVPGSTGNSGSLAHSVGRQLASRRSTTYPTSQPAGAGHASG